MAKSRRISPIVLAFLSAAALTIPPVAAAQATPISDENAAELYKQCYDYCIGDDTAESCQAGCTCMIRLTQKQFTLEEVIAMAKNAASPETLARTEAISKQCNR